MPPVDTVRKKDIIRTVIRARSAQRMAKRHLKLVSPAIVNRTVTPKRLPNAELRTREYLTEAEVERLMDAAKDNRYGHRDATMILVAYRHGLRVSELVDLRWDQIEFASATLARPPGQAGHAQHPPDPRGRIAGAAAAQARAGAQVAVRVHVGARRALHHRRLCPHGRAGRGRGQAGLQGPPAHAAARLRLRAGEQGTRYAGPASLPRPPQHPAYRALHSSFRRRGLRISGAGNLTPRRDYFPGNSTAFPSFISRR